MKKSILFVVFALALATCSKESSPAPPKRVAIDVTESGFTPARVEVPKDTAVTLVFDRKTDATCVKKVVLEVDGKTIERDLPLNQPVEVAVTFPKAGELTYACGMDMVHGTLAVR